ncbi:MAG: CoA transferase [Dehalococcoidia bacterium]|nr:CoA transferase [Dehalococcoidia bacterium]
MTAGALSHIRICDFTGQLAGAGATKFLAAFGAEVIRIEDPVREGRWDILRGMPPYKPDQSGLEAGGAFNNHNVNKLGITLNLRTDGAKEVLRKLIAASDVVSENFAAGVLERMGFGYEELKAIKPDIIYVSNCGFGHRGPYTSYKTWGPIVQAISGLTHTSGLPDQPPAGWGYSYMDHTGAYYMAIAIMAALHHRNATGEGQWVDLACTEAGAALNGPAILDYTVNGRPARREGVPDANHSYWPEMAPHNIYPASGDDNWVAIACRSDDEWKALAGLVNERWTQDPRFDRLSGRLEWQDELDANIRLWTEKRDKFIIATRCRGAGVPAAPVQKPEERIDHDPNTGGWGLWPTVKHTHMGDVRVDGIPVHMSETDWSLTRGAGCLGEHNEDIICGLLGYSKDDLARFREEGIV